MTKGQRQVLAAVEAAAADYPDLTIEVKAAHLGNPPAAIVRYGRLHLRVWLSNHKTPAEVAGPKAAALVRTVARGWGAR